MTRAIVTHSQVLVNLSLNVITQTEHDTRMVTLPIIQLTPIIFVLWQVVGFVLLIKTELSLLARDIVDALMITGKLFMVGFNALAFGVGVSL